MIRVRLFASSAVLSNTFYNHQKEIQNKSSESRMYLMYVTVKFRLMHKIAKAAEIRVIYLNM